MTLTELIPIIEQLSVPDKLKLFNFLAEQLDAKQDISPLEPNKVYYMPTPYDVFGAGEILMEAMKLNHDENISAFDLNTQQLTPGSPEITDTF